MSGLEPSLPPPVLVQMRYESQHIEQLIRGVSHYNELLMGNGEPPLHPAHPLIKLQSTLIQMLPRLVEDGLREGYSIGPLLELKTEIQDLLDSVGEADELQE